jgi:hypothetical protein
LGRLRGRDDAAERGGFDLRRVLDHEGARSRAEAMPEDARLGVERGLDPGTALGLEQPP